MDIIVVVIVLRREGGEVVHGVYFFLEAVLALVQEAELVEHLLVSTEWIVDINLLKRIQCLLIVKLLPDLFVLCCRLESGFLEELQKLLVVLCRVLWPGLLQERLLVFAVDHSLYTLGIVAFAVVEQDFLFVLVLHIAELCVRVSQQKLFLHF